MIWQRSRVPRKSNNAETAAIKRCSSNSEIGGRFLESIGFTFVTELLGVSEARIERGSPTSTGAV